MFCLPRPAPPLASRLRWVVELLLVQKPGSLVEETMIGSLEKKAGPSVEINQDAVFESASVVIGYRRLYCFLLL